ncbi:MAG: FHA domain-containing protein [Spartobacteria bacterium]|nr:FHA domain-containing protein [Spartobacteria bacterium]
MYRLIFQEGPFKGKRLTVQQGTVVIGRDPDSHIHIPDDKISWRHAAIELREDGSVYIRDMGSLNRIIVNGQDVREARLSNADRITIGNTTFTYQKLQAVVSEQARKVSYVQRVTFTAVITILVLQGIFLLALSLWRFGAISGNALLPGGEIDTNLVALIVRRSAEPAPTPESVVKTPEEPTPTPTPEPTTAPATPPPQQQAAPTPEPIPVIPDIPIVRSTPAVKEPGVSPTPAPTPEAPVTTPRPAPASTPAKEQVANIDLPGTPPDMPNVEDDPLMEIAREMMEEALIEIGRHNYVQADQQLERVQIVCPDYFPAYAERAKLYEKRAMLTEAGEEWGQLLRRAAGTTWHAYAANERARVARAEMLKNTIKPPVVNKANEKTPSGKLPENIRIDGVKRQTFEKTREYDEMRILTITVRQNIGAMNIQGEDVQVKVYFYDRIRGTGMVTPTQVVVPDESMTFDGLWPPDERRTATAAYIVPTDFRRMEKEQFGEARSYFGYVVEVYYEGILQDRAARPKTLLDL